MRYNYTWEEVEHGGREYIIELSIDYDVTPYRPAKIDCDPDDGYPAEGGEVVINEVEVLSATLFHTGATLLDRSDKRYWAERFTEQIDDDFRLELAEHLAAYDEAARDEADEARNER